MKKMFKRWISLLITAAIIVGASPMWQGLFGLRANAVKCGGSCGEYLTWALDATGNLEIDGIGDMDDSDWDWYYDKSSIKSVTIKYGVTSICDGAFWGCPNLTNVIIPNSVKEIGDRAFEVCESLTTINLPDSIIHIGRDAFNGTAYYDNELNWENKVLYIGKHLIKAKDTINGEYVIKNGTLTIAGGAFDGCNSLTSVKIPDSVTSVGDHAFAYCHNLMNINIPDSVASIGGSAFFSCTNLDAVLLPDVSIKLGDSLLNGTACYNKESNWENEVLYIGKHLIAARDVLNGEYSIKEGTLNVADNAFRFCDLTRIKVPASVLTIGRNSFNSNELTFIEVDNNNTNYSSDKNGILFNKGRTHIILCPMNSALIDYTVPDSVLSIGYRAFEFCELRSVNIPESVESIDVEAFAKCKSLSSITLPSTTIDIGALAFYDTAYENDLSNWSGNGLYIGNHLIDGEDSESVTCVIKEETITIAESALGDFSELKSITIPNSVKRIGYGHLGVVKIFQMFTMKEQRMNGKIF